MTSGSNLGSGHKEKAGEKEAEIRGILWYWFHCVKLRPMCVSQQRLQDENYFPLVFTVHVQEGGTADSCTLQIGHLENFCYFPSITSEILIIHCKKIKNIMEWGVSFGKTSNEPCLFHPLKNTPKFDSGCPRKFPKVNGLCKAVM